MNLLKIEKVKYQDEITSIKEIRSRVFQEEQGVSAELEFDGLDADAVHFLAYLDDRPVGTARVRQIDRQTAKIERLAVSIEARNQGVGKQLMYAALTEISQQNKIKAIVHAQEYIASLYQQLGFEIIGEKFSEAGIPHVKMIKQLNIEH
ncbi:MAG: GNAT family N-acetyltransferase [Cyanobacteria bacterium P01_G01_bin.19]